jgi:hypothetical protein
MNYNIFIETQYNVFNILDINEDNLFKIIKTYNLGNDSVFIKGKKYYFNKLKEIQIYTFEHKMSILNNNLLEHCVANGYCKHQPIVGEWIPQQSLEKFGKNVTDNFINNDFGYLKIQPKNDSLSEYYIDPNRIIELESIKNNLFDFTKLVRLLKEINTAYKNNLFLSVPLLVRATIDHIPPVFDKQNFKDLCGSYGNRSFKESMTHLEKSSRKIADSFLHTKIRNKESLPTKTQINFRNDLDVLLQEIVRINKVK